MQEGFGAVKPGRPRIAAIQGAANRTIQNAMWRFAKACADRGMKVAGLIETFAPEGAPRRYSATLQSVRSGQRYPIFQDLGPMASACHLDGSGIVAACAAVCEDIEHGCDLAVLSKFGQLEAKRSGLLDAFAAAVARETPILTAVSPVYMKEWRAFSSDFGVILPADDEALCQWWLGADFPADKALTIA